MSDNRPRCNPACSNGGTCLQSPNGSVCLCPSEYTGSYCQTGASETTSYIIIGVVLFIGFLLTILVYAVRCCMKQNQQTRPRAAQRIISVQGRCSVTIEKNDDAPPAYDDLSHNNGLTEENDGTICMHNSQQLAPGNVDEECNDSNGTIGLTSEPNDLATDTNYLRPGANYLTSNTDCLGLDNDGYTSDNSSTLENDLPSGTNESLSETNDLQLITEDSSNNFTSNRLSDTSLVNTETDSVVTTAASEVQQMEDSTIEDQPKHQTEEPPSYDFVQQNRASDHKDKRSSVPEDTSNENNVD